MFGGHLPELIVLLLAALVIFGPKRLPEIGGAMGKGIREFKKGTSENDEKNVTAPQASEHEKLSVASPVVEPRPGVERETVVASPSHEQQEKS